MPTPKSKDHTPTTLAILVGLLLLVASMGVALGVGSWHVAGLAAIGFVSWLIACVIVDVIVNRNRE